MEASHILKCSLFPRCFLSRCSQGRFLSPFLFLLYRLNVGEVSKQVFFWSSRQMIYLSMSLVTIKIWPAENFRPPWFAFIPSVRQTVSLSNPLNALLLTSLIVETLEIKSSCWERKLLEAQSWNPWNVVHPHPLFYSFHKVYKIQGPAPFKLSQSCYQLLTGHH